MDKTNKMAIVKMNKRDWELIALGYIFGMLVGFVAFISVMVLWFL